MLRISGASDDLIEIDGDWSEELQFNGAESHAEDGGVSAMVCSDGSMWKVLYDGQWRFLPVLKGSVPYTKDEAEGEDAGQRPDGTAGYSDRLTFHGEIRWVCLVEPDGIAQP